MGVAQNDFFIGTGDVWVCTESASVLTEAHEVARTEEVNASDFELGASERADIPCDAHLRQMIGQDLALFKQGGDQAIGHTTVVGAFTHRINSRIGDRLHGVAHDDAIVTVQSARLRQAGVGSNAHGHHHQVGFNALTIAQDHMAHAPSGACHDALGLRTNAKFQAPLFKRLLQEVASNPVELSIHQPRRHMDDGDLHATLGQAIGRFKTQQSSANDHGVCVDFGRFNHGGRVGNVPVGHYTVKFNARQGQHEGVGSGGKNQSVISCCDDLSFVCPCVDQAFDAVDLKHQRAQVQGNTLLVVPTLRVEDDFIKRLLSRQDRRQGDAVVVGVWLIAKDRDVIKVG